MKFGDKLIELRKKNGYSQEELAEKLGVSRQSVSKWESNNTYPETDKIIQIANLFDCSMDDLINDKVTNVESTLRKNRSNVKNIWNSFLGFITGTIEMFSKMTFLEGLKCVIVILLLGFFLNIAGIMICNTAAGVISSIFSFFKPEVVSLIRDILKGIFHLVWSIISTIAIIHAFKIKYLNKYTTTKEVKTTTTTTNNNSEKEKQVVVNENEKPFEFLEVLAKIVIVFIKILAAWIILWTTFTTIGLVVASVVLLPFVPTNLLFVWILLLLLAATTVSIQIIVLLIKFIFNRKVNAPLNIIIFLSCVVLSGISIGLTALQIRNIEFIEDDSIFNYVEKTIDVDYKENLAIKSIGVDSGDQYKYIIDNSLEDNKIIISKQIDEKYFEMNEAEMNMDNLPVILIDETGKRDPKVYIELLLNQLKKNKIVTFQGYGNNPLIIKANETTTNKLINNLKLLYLVKEERDNDIINITIKEDKVYFKQGLNGDYYAIDDSIKNTPENYTCKKEIVVTEYGERIVYTCGYGEEE